MPARVPGHILPDLMLAGLAADPDYGTQERDVQWVEEETWVYRTKLQRPAKWSPWDSLRLTFEGLDTYARVVLDGETMLQADNAFRSWTTSPFLLDDGAHTLEVIFDPVAVKGQERLDRHGLVVPAGNELRPIGKQTSPMTRKAGYQFGWDWGPRLAGPGIPLPVHLIQAGEVLKRRLHPPPSCHVVEADDEVGRIVIRGHQEWDLALTLKGQPVPFSWDGDTLVVPKPKLWWPVNFGEQPLYSCHWRHASGIEEVHRLGIRTVEWSQLPDAWGTSFQLVINGVALQARGANVVPPGFHHGYSEEEWCKLVHWALEANMNMVRVWGGGVYPPDSFFDACDENGLLVWQDFMFACNMVPNDSAFFDNVRMEAREQVRRLRHRPSLVLWCGNNEVKRAWHQWGWQELYDLHGQDSTRLAEAYNDVFHDILAEEVAHGSSTKYHPTSPTLDPRSGDEHAWDVWFGLEDFSYFSRNNGRFVSEFGVQSLPEEHTLREVGVNHFQDEALQYRQRSKMDWLEPGFDGWDMMNHFMTKTVGPSQPDNLKDWVFRSQAMQAECLRQALERHRTSGGRHAGSLYWSLNDVWPAVSWSTVDDAGRWKLGHYAARRANAPRTALWMRQRTDSLCFAVFNESTFPLEGFLHVEVQDFKGTVLKHIDQAILLEANQDATFGLGPLDTWKIHPEQTVLTWSLEETDGSEIVRASALWQDPVDVALSSANVTITSLEQNWIIQTDTYLPVLRLTASVPGHFSDNGMAVLPDEPVIVSFVPEHAQQPSEIQLGIQTLNPSVSASAE
ncbi:MAG: hypothetical protein O3B70_06690 [Bacteroidetes bacterium]|nr:hypothetical protein [Bacteroidota bacterium]MDA0904006.1 hypothetical protein [Bacteroidota bacterium]MDA1243004.1 hypothetical protein [Bacteroidota bacterium]